MKRPEPPRFILHFLKWFCKPEYHTDIEGDLLEIYEKRIADKGKMQADLRLCKDVLLLFRPGIIRTAAIHQPIANNDMIRSYFKMGWRNLLKSKLYSSLNVLGLTFGMVCFLLIGLYVYDELTYDDQHLQADRIYRVITHEKNTWNGIVTVAASSYMLAEESRQAIPEVERTTRMMRMTGANLVDPENPVNVQETVTVADEHFLQVFDFPLIEGDRTTALKEPNSVIITEDLAGRIFGTVDVMNKALQFSHLKAPLKITGVLKNHPHNSTFNFTSVISESTMHNVGWFKSEIENDWSSTMFSTYALLRPQSNKDSVSGKMKRLVRNHASFLSPGTDISYSLQPLKDVHLRSEGIIDGGRSSSVEAIAQGNPVYVTVFAFTAIFVLLIAGINYTNLTTARASGRVKEIGVRKAIGAMRGNLIRQFLVESLITTVIAFSLALIIVALLLPPFNDLVNKKFSLFTSVGLRFWAIAVGLIILIGLLSSGYASMLLSRFNPVLLLKGLKASSSGDLSVRKTLVVVQFTISTIMIIGTIVLFMQVRFLNSADLGFNKELMVVIDMNVNGAKTNFESLKTEMSKIPAVQHVSVSSRVPGEWKRLRRLKVKPEGSANDHIVTYALGADKDFLSTYGIPLLSGRNFTDGNDSSAVLINEAAATMLGITDAGGQVLDIPQMASNSFFFPIFDNNESFRPHVAGIIKDFHFQSLRDRIEPLIILYNNNPIQDIDYYSVKISPQNVQATLDNLKAIMVANDESEPFEYHFLDSQLARFYIEDQRSQTILGWVALASVIIACLGLFGLATYSAEQRLKEIGMRKVLGANLLSIFSLLSKDFVRLVLIACGVAFPIAWLGANWWLEAYAYHIKIEWWIFALAGLLATGIALLTVSYQAIKTAVVNPVKILRSE